MLAPWKQSYNQTAAAAAKLHQSCLTVWPHRRKPTRLLCPWDYPGKSNQTSSILKCTDITLLTKVHLVKAMVFPLIMYGCESWTKKKAECRRTDAFELWCWRRLLRVPWTARRSNKPILKEINPKYSLEVLMLKQKVQYFGHLMWRTDFLERPWCWERLKAGGQGDDRGWDSLMASLTQWTWVWVSSKNW